MFLNEPVVVNAYVKGCNKLPQREVGSEDKMWLPGQNSYMFKAFLFIEHSIAYIVTVLQVDNLGITTLQSKSVLGLIPNSSLKN